MVVVKIARNLFLCLVFAVNRFIGTVKRAPTALRLLYHDFKQSYRLNQLQKKFPPVQLSRREKALVRSSHEALYKVGGFAALRFLPCVSLPTVSDI
jgi:hypothetical protein